MTGLTTLVANFLGTRFVVFPLSLFEDLSEALDDERHLLVVELGGVGCRGGASLDDLFGAFDHQFKAHKLPYNLLGRHKLVSRITMN
jgi:hypothetical protein